MLSVQSGGVCAATTTVPAMRTAMKKIATEILAALVFISLPFPVHPAWDSTI